MEIARLLNAGLAHSPSKCERRTCGPRIPVASRSLGLPALDIRVVKVEYMARKSDVKRHHHAKRPKRAIRAPFRRASPESIGTICSVAMKIAANGENRPIKSGIQHRFCQQGLPFERGKNNCANRPGEQSHPNFATNSFEKMKKSAASHPS
jgi:hypothetical protein